MQVVLSVDVMGHVGQQGISSNVVYGTLIFYLFLFKRDQVFLLCEMCLNAKKNKNDFWMK